MSQVGGQEQGTRAKAKAAWQVKPLATVLLLSFCLLHLFSIPLFAASLDDVRASLNTGATLFSSDSPLHVKADLNTFDNARNIWVGEGNVHIQNDEHELRADHVTVNHATGDVSARGNITLVRPGLGTWTGESLDYNHITRSGLIGPSEINARGATIIAEQITASSNNIYQMSGAQFTTCTNSACSWHYHLRASRLTYNDGRRHATFHHATAWFMGVPIAYFPYWYRNLDGYGIRLTPGYTSDWGAFLLGGYLYKLSPFENPAHNLDGRFRLDYRTDRGVALGNDFSWQSPAYGIGSFSVYWLNDLDPPRYESFNPLRADERVRASRHRVAFKNVLAPTERDRFIFQVETHSDPLFLHNFFEEQFRTTFQPDNFAAYTRRHENWAAGATIASPVDVFYDGVARLPEAWFLLPATPLGAGFFYETQSRAGYHQTFFSDWARELGVRNYDALRLDTHHRVSYPLSIHPDIPVAITPRAAWRGTFYSTTSRLQDDFITYGPSTATGMRNLFELGANVSTKWYGGFNEGRTLHVFQPYADYAFIPASRDLDARSLPGNSDQHAYAFDRYDNYREWRDLFGFDNALPVSKWHGLRFGARNLLQTGPPSRRRTLLDTDIYAAHIFDADATSRGLGLVGTRTRFVPHRTLIFRLNTDFDPQDGVLRYFDLYADWAWQRHSLSGGWLRRDDPVFAQTLRSDDATGILYARYNQSVARKWGWGVESRYNTGEQHIDEIAATLTYRIDCMTFQIRTSHRPSYTSASGISQGSNTKIAFLVRLNSTPNQTPAELENSGVVP